MKMFTAVAGYLFVLASPLSAFAVTQQQRDCLHERDADRRIAACSAVISQPDKTLSAKSQIFDLTVSYSNRALALVSKAEYQRALADIDKTISLSVQIKRPDLYLAYNIRGLIFKGLGQFDRAISDFDETIRLNSNYAEAFSNRGNTRYETREFSKALADHNRAVQLDPANGTFYTNRANLWSKVGKYSNAISDYNEAIARAPDGKIYALRGRSWRLLGDLDRALEDQARAIEIDPNGSLVYVERGDTLRYAGQFEAALNDYDKALQKAPNYIPAIVGIGLTYERLNDTKQAREQFLRAAASTSAIKFHDISKEALETAAARLAALDSGQTTPPIPPSPRKSDNSDSIPTPSIQPAAIPQQAAPSPKPHKVALIIANASYTHIGTLRNPRRDGEVVAKSLSNLGFAKVTVITDGSRDTIMNALRNFAADVRDADWAMVYYSGHGAEARGTNYLLPIDAILNGDQGIGREAIAMSHVLSAVDSAKKLKIVVLDACRNYPPSIRRAVLKDEMNGEATLSQSEAMTPNGGLAPVRIQNGTLVVFAAKDGQVALDGKGDNSPFAVALVQRIGTPGVEISKVFRLVRDDVMEATAGRQEPYTYGSLPGKEDFYFVEK